MTGRWRVASPAALSWRSWAGEIVVYDDGSGDTHYLEPLAAEVFERLLDAPADLDELAARVAQSLAVDRDEAILLDRRGVDDEIAVGAVDDAPVEPPFEDRHGVKKR